MTEVLEIYKGKNEVGEPYIGPGHDTRQKALKKAGLIALLTETTDLRVKDYPVLKFEQFRDVVEVFPTAYMHKSESLNWGARGVFWQAVRDWKDYNYKESIPSGLLPVIHELLRERPFYSLEIRTPEYRTERISFGSDPLLFGVLRNGTRALIARWGSEEFITMGEISFVAELRRKFLTNGGPSELLFPMRRAMLRRKYPQYAGYFDGVSAT